MAITKGLKHANRYRQIATTLAKHGFGYILREVGLFHILSLPKRLSAESDDFNAQSIGTRLRLVIEELGPTFIKLGQLVSMRKDIFPPSIVEELEKLQDEVPPFSVELGKRMIEHDLHAPVDEIFQSFTEEPLAAASIGQVHYAVLHTGEEVAVKISRPQIKEMIEKDIDVLRDLARLLCQRFQWARYYRLDTIVEEYVEAIRDEADYYTEARNTQKMAKNMEPFPAVYIPYIYEEYCSRRVLTMEFIHGEKLHHLEESPIQYDKKKLARQLADSFLHQMMINGFFHSDPHPGNIIFTGKDTAAYIDFGQVARLSRSMRWEFVNYVIAMTKKKPDEVTKAIYEMADFPEDLDTELFTEDIEYLLSKYYETSFHDMSIGKAINDIFATAHRYEIKIHKEYVMLAKAVITIESVVEELDPDLSIMELSEPYGKRLFKEKIHPKRYMDEAVDEAKKQSEYLWDMPKHMRDSLERVAKGKIGVDMDIPEIQIILNKMDRISNRLSFSVILLAFSIIMVGLIIGSTFGASSSPLVQIPVIEIGFIISFFMFIWLLFAIFRSGRF
ncbi:2-octaprenylphenol hydroxylase [Sinobaca qinghaiensis]|uniref:2-octaprenylphenol hydroxylase n=1 Tax=Sinobaca qinghaiensis TaxID=342944 RepID=A0A419V2R5_9BACL|nr:AarF/ABC1/UbiB kinase family protein [Sinobaca qinghaiensis]RKD72809.1 2-octaprenylphenol hydroxylase [Sinobaca qinghaiensis]